MNWAKMIAEMYQVVKLGKYASMQVCRYSGNVGMPVKSRKIYFDCRYSAMGFLGMVASLNDLRWGRVEVIYVLRRL